METITIQGETFRVENEELVLPSDPEGDKKVDEKGRLLGGREYKGYNFTSDLREDPERVYMLSIDAARSAGYRDSLYFFRKNPKIIKITLHQREKDKLIEDGRLSGQLKSRNVTMVAVRNVYKLHGAKFIKGGKSVIDDYYEAEARASGKKEGQAVGGISQEEQERRREADKERDRSRRRPDTYTHTSVDAQGEPFTTTFGDSGLNPLARAGNWSLRKQMLQRADVNEENWMLELAKSVRGMNTELYETRRDRLVAFRRFDNGLAEQEYYESSDEDEDEDEDEEGEAGAEGDADPADDEQAKEDLPPWERESQKSASPPAAAGSIIKSKTEDNDDAMQVDQQEGGGETSGLSSSAAAVAKKARRKRPAPPIGIYEPFTHLPHFATSTQPAWARIEKVAARPKYIKDPRQQTKDGTGASDDVPILGGGRMGATAWGLASFSTELVNPPPPSSVVRIPAPPKLSEGDDSKPNL
ncbi:hypothetical protein IE53DRAFT_335603 [Violaceomyces palustris]|uniref:Uncharacterized protein n=1 Tax=Violaceomyces palustris TaxID=1673888 RepID=A0ACD0NNG6_9BASI|nr:hypothetical protein IE53DRAFT_335603 [Violaceomyces palustris]